MVAEKNTALGSLVQNELSPKIGVYFSANDVVYDWTIAFLNSFRAFNPHLRLILIPFNDNCDRLFQLQERYNFEVYIDPIFDRLEAIGEAFELGHTPTGRYWFRRYAAFWGTLERFMYLDARQVVLSDLTPLIAALDRFDFDFLHYDCAVDQVYEPGEFRQQLLRQGKGRGFNSGRWAARKGLFSIEELERLAADALKIREQLNPRNTDQAFINYCCDLKSIRSGHFAEVIGGICQSGWVRQSGTIYQTDECYRRWDYGGLDHQKQVILLHWAGYKLSATMPHRNLFDRYWLQDSSMWQKWSASVGNSAKSLIEIYNMLRKNRLINTFYHQLKNRT
jgi:hypothetical protein